MSRGSSSRSTSGSPPVDADVDPAMEAAFGTRSAIHDDDPHSDSPVPTFFTASQVAELIRTLFGAIGTIVNERPMSEALLFSQTPAAAPNASGATTTPTSPSSSSTPTIDVLQLLSVRHAITLPRLLSHCPLLMEGDFLELQEPTFRAVSTLFDSNLVLPLKELRQALLGKDNGTNDTSAFFSTASGEGGLEMAAVTVPMAANSSSATIPPPPAAMSQVRLKSAKSGGTSPPKRASGSAPAVRRNPVTAGAIASAKQSLFRPQSAGIGTPKGQAATIVSTVDLSAAAANPVRPGTAGPQAVGTAALGSHVPLPAAAASVSLPTPEEQVARTFQEIERQLKDETGHSRFSATEFRVEAEIEDHTNIDRRAKAVQARERDQSLLHSLDYQRREFMIQYFSNPELVERRRRDMLQEEMLREARQARAAQIMSCRSPSQSPLGTRPASSPPVAPTTQQHQRPRQQHSADDDTSGLISAAKPAATVPEGASGKRSSWAGSQNPLEVWNAVRTRPASAAALLPISHVHAAESVVAKKYLPPQPGSNSSGSGGIPPRAASAASTRDCTFAEMIARKRESILAEAKMGLLPGDELSVAPASAGRGTPSPVERTTGSAGGDEAENGRGASGWAADQRSPGRRRGGNDVNHSRPGSGLIAIIHPDTGLHQKRSDLVQLIEAASVAAIRPSSAAADSVSSPTSTHGLTTTITTAAYLPMSQKAAPSSMLLRSPPRSASSGRHSRARARIQDVRDASAEQTAHADLSEFLPQAKRTGNGGGTRSKKR